MDFLSKIRDFQFEGYSKSALKQTSKNISELQNDSNSVWEMWKKCARNPSESFKVDFDFYSSDKNGVISFSEILKNNMS